MTKLMYFKGMNSIIKKKKNTIDYEFQLCFANKYRN